LEETAEADVLLAASDDVTIKASGTCGGEGDGTNLTWTLDGEHTLTISGIGNMKNFSYRGAPWYSYSFSNTFNRWIITSVVILDGVTSIGDYAFQSCDGVTSVEIPNSVTSIGFQAFGGCSKLPSIEIPNSVTSIGSLAFYYCRSLSSIEIPNSVTSLKYDVFDYCSSLTSVKIPASVTSIDSYAFDRCSSLVSFFVDPNNLYYSSIDGVLFNKEQTILLQYPTNGAKNYVIPNSVTNIRARAFKDCSALTSIEIPNSVTNIGAYAFMNCSSLTRVKIPASVTSIDDRVFENCRSLTNFSVDPNNLYYASIDGVLFNKEQTILIQCPINGIKSCTIPNSVSSINYYAFFSCSNLESVEISKSVTSIGEEAFGNCSSLTGIYFQGNAPSVKQTSDRHPSFPANVTLYYIEGKSGWGSPTWRGYNTATWSGEMPIRPIRLENVSFTYQSTKNGEKTCTGLTYDDNWFHQDSYTYNHELATMSLGLAMAGFEHDPDSNGNYRSNGDAHIKDLYGELGFDEENYEVEGYGTQDDGTVGIAMSSKQILDENGNSITLLAVTLRGGGYGSGGWVGNFEVNATGAYHAGFYKAADYAAKQISSYLSNHGVNKKTVRIWLTGYSRSAATANLASQLLSARGLCLRKNIYTYTFATPSNQIISGFDTQYSNIFNIVSMVDIVPQVPLQDWNFGKQGTTYVVPETAYANDAMLSQFNAQFKKLSGETYRVSDNQELSLFYLTGLLANWLPNRGAYYRELQDLLEASKGKGNVLISALNLRLFDLRLTLPEMQQDIENWDFLQLSIKLVAANSKISNVGISNLLYELCEVCIRAKIESSSLYNGNTSMNRDLLLMIADLISYLGDGDAFSSELLSQHWPESYMAWMLTTDKSDLFATNYYKIATVACPVDVEVVDASGNVVAKTKTETFTVEDEDGTEYTYTVSVIDEEYTTIGATVIGENKMFILPDGEEYSIRIVTNETYEEGDTMTYSVTTFENSTSTSSITYEAVELNQDSEFSATVTTSEKEIQTCTLSSGEDQLEPTQVVTQTTISHMVTDFVLEKEDDVYQVSGQLGAISQDVVVYCAAYRENGQFLMAVSREFEVSDDPQEIQMDIDASDVGYVKLFVLDSVGNAPLDECIQIPVV
jgi:hypothetical protein